MAHLALASFDHERVNITTGRRSGLPIVVAIHSTALGPALGGCRLWSYPTLDDAVLDALRLSAGMTAKNALAGLDAGGGKTVIALPEAYEMTDAKRRNIFLDLGDAIEGTAGSYITAEDVGTTSADMSVVAERTGGVVGLPLEGGGHGNPAPYTADGVLAALGEVLLRLFGTSDVARRRITVIGLGQVGSRLARTLSAAGASLTLADIDPAKRRLAEELGATWSTPAEALIAPADILMPAGVGGLLTPEVIAELNVAAVVGPANNQLANSDGAAELADRGILYAPDFLVNAGGVLYLGLPVDQGDEVNERIAGIGATLREIFRIADDKRVTSLQAANRLVESRLAAANQLVER